MVAGSLPLSRDVGLIVMATNLTLDSGRAPDGRFLPGTGGRKKGSRNKSPGLSTLIAVNGLASEAVSFLGEQMRAGNMAAIKLILDYTLPRGGRPIDLDGTMEPNELIEAATSGEISPDEFARLAQGWKTAAEASDVKELSHKVEELELLITSLRK